MLSQLGRDVEHRAAARIHSHIGLQIAALSCSVQLTKLILIAEEWPRCTFHRTSCTQFVGVRVEKNHTGPSILQHRGVPVLYPGSAAERKYQRLMSFREYRPQGVGL